MNLKLENKTALVTGSTKGIGFAIAQALASEGANVILNGRSEASTQAAVKKIGGRARGVAAVDVTCADAVERSHRERHRRAHANERMAVFIPCCRVLFSLTAMDRL